VSSVGTPRRADACVIACAEIYRGDGEIFANPTVGHVPFIGARLARRTFEPDLVMTDGEAMLVASTLPVGDGRPPILIEGWLPYRLSFDVVWSGRRHVVMGASQVDRYGDTNIACIGPWEKPVAQLLGCRGAPGNTVNDRTSYWVPNHGPRVFVERVDFVSGVGPRRAREAGGTLPGHNQVRFVVTNLCVFDFDGPACAARLRALHPGATVEEVVAATGFEIAGLDGDVAVGRPPTAEEMLLIEEIDPAGLRYREVAG
jgi:acyl CoA:acetate/3-ketoacid CoA transferase beta subunit